MISTIKSGVLGLIALALALPVGAQAPDPRDFNNYNPGFGAIPQRDPRDYNPGFGNIRNHSGVLGNPIQFPDPRGPGANPMGYWRNRIFSAPGYSNGTV